jgi:hypothetical protein
MLNIHAENLCPTFEVKEEKPINKEKFYLGSVWYCI